MTHANENRAPRIVLVAAVARNGVIGGKGGLLWRISSDLQRFKSITMGKPIVMGRKTFESIGRPLPGRDNIVITKSHEFKPEGVYVAHAIDDAMKLASECARKSGADEICIIGGGEIYAAMINDADRIYLTLVDAAPEGDAVFPEIDYSDWIKNSESGCKKNQKNDHDCEFFILDRRVRGPEK